MAKSYCWCITQWIHNYTSSEWYVHVRNLPNFVYACYGVEGLDTGVTPHFQMVIVFDKQVGLATMRRYFKQAHCSNMRNDLMTNIKYCQKEGQWSEIGKHTKSYDHVKSYNLYRSNDNFLGKPDIKLHLNPSRLGKSETTISESIRESYQEALAISKIQRVRRNSSSSN